MKKNINMENEKKNVKSHMNGYWNYERCFEEAKKYITITDFSNGCQSACFRAKESGWIKDYTWFVDGKALSAAKRTIWDYESCYDLAKKCTSKSDLKRKNQRAYIVSLRNGWITDFTWFIPESVLRKKERPYRRVWAYEKCKEAASECKNTSEFIKKYPSAYTISNRNGWLDDFDWLRKDKFEFANIPDNVYAYFFLEHKAVYVGRTINISNRDLSHNSDNKSAVYRFATKNNLEIPEMTVLKKCKNVKEGLEFEDYYRHKFEDEGWNVLNKAKTGIKSGSIGGLAKDKWNYKRCYKEAKKYKTLKDLRKGSPSAYNVMYRNGWQNEYSWLKTDVKKRGYWTYENCYNEAKKYSSRKEFGNGSKTAYVKACTEKWINDYKWFKPSATALKWNYENSYKEAKKYKKLSDFRKNGGACYGVSRRNGWLKDYTWLSAKDISKKKSSATFS